MKSEQKAKEREIIRRAIDGDERAFETLVSNYRNLVFGIVIRLISNQTDAEDLVQEIFTKVYLALDRYNGEFAFATWLIKIATNHSIDFLRKNKLKTTPIHENDKGHKNTGRMIQFKSSEPSPDTHLIKSERKHQIQEAINSLPEKYRIIIVLRHNEEKNYDEIAKLLNIPIGTVKARLFRAREMLNRKLKDILSA